ncbi:MAG: dipeptidase [Deltaproteobacteria bacterium]|nr:dipeptidase [Deltaproteobacteria bacterium]
MTIDGKYKEYTIIDMHSHFLINAFLLKKDFFQRGKTPLFWNPFRNFYDYERAREGGVKGITFNIYVPYFPKILGGRMGGVKRFVEIFNKIVEKSEGRLLKCTTSYEIETCIKNGKMAAILAIEGGNIIGNELSNLSTIKEHGVRMVTLVHFLTTHIGDAVFGREIHGGLSDFGKRMVKDMQRLGIIADLAHATDKAFFDAIRISEAPVVSSHTGVRALKPDDQRGLSDEQLFALRDNRGLAGIIFFPWYLKKMKIFCKLDLVIDHICYVADKIGVDYVGIGSDMDSNIWLPLDFKDASYFPLIPYKLEQRGFKKEEIEKVMGLNYLRVLRETERR